MKIKKLFTLPSLSDDPSVVGLLHAKDQQVPVATMMVQYLGASGSPPRAYSPMENVEFISKTKSHLNSPIQPVQKSDGECRLPVNYCDLHKPLSTECSHTGHLRAAVQIGVKGRQVIGHT